MKLQTAFAGLTLLLIAGATLAQPVYRNVDKNGKVTFSDQPPSANAPAAPARAGNSVASAGGGLPYELRQVVQRYPVTLYANEDCGPCAAGRSLLVTRGVPFDERTVKSNEDVAALQRLSGQNSLPLLSIGAQQLKGFSDAEWSQYLDAAGYPKFITYLQHKHMQLGLWMSPLEFTGRPVRDHRGHSTSDRTADRRPVAEQRLPLSKSSAWTAAHLVPAICSHRSSLESNIGLDDRGFGTHSLRRTKVAQLARPAQGAQTSIATGRLPYAPAAAACRR